MTNHETHNRPEAFAPKTGVLFETTPNGSRTNFYMRNHYGTAFRITIFWNASKFARMYRFNESGNGFTHWNSLRSYESYEELLKGLEPTANAVKRPTEMARYAALLKCLDGVVNGAWKGTDGFMADITAEAVEPPKEPTPDQRREVHADAVEAFKEAFSTPHAAKVLAEASKPEPKPFEYLGEEISKPAIRIKELRDQVNSFKGRITAFQKAGWMLEGDDEHNAQREQFRFCHLVDELVAELESIRQNVAGI